MSETIADLLIAAHSAETPQQIAAARARLAHALSETGPVFFQGIVYRGTWTPEKWRVQGDGAEVLEMMRAPKSEPAAAVNGDSESPDGADSDAMQFRPDLLPPDTEIAKVLGVPLASDVLVPEGI